MRKQTEMWMAATRLQHARDWLKTARYMLSKAPQTVSVHDALRLAKPSLGLAGVAAREALAHLKRGKP